jgi:hypothetical protein
MKKPEERESQWWKQSPHRRARIGTQSGFKASEKSLTAWSLRYFTAENPK